MKVVFIVTEIADIRKTASSLEIGKEYVGMFIESNNSVSWTDPINEQDWVFWVGDTCEIVNNLKNYTIDKDILNAKKNYNSHIKMWQYVTDDFVHITCKTEKGLESNWIKYKKVFAQ
ncbi:hypothetical protein SAMN05660493_01529 [Epilithonimonas bovis DSM 19482]|uniref:Uncharacterized protein n=1 Tax=Epilithonimonas bovis DSM 19482 TaxID=1121284 RepID=A0A1U7PWF7_9FLAO|nr:hypothetical protein [Epilithonimonas bovis]SIT96834.1 hypothetical protein SAMN05660493_01529 [Epilithonimonas bovis DSM 19482]